jgi:hypothetical protein
MPPSLSEWDPSTTEHGRTPSFTEEISSFNPERNGFISSPKFGNKDALNNSNLDVSVVSGYTTNSAYNIDMMRAH